MNKLSKLSDKRLVGYCTYCGKKPETKDHVPSKILLDSPFPENLPVVSCCKKCNQNFSKDEEYFACLVECIIRGTTEPAKLVRKKVIDILERKPKLKARLTRAMENHVGQTHFRAEEERTNKVILKLARGHATFENSELQLEEPFSVKTQPIHLMNEVEINEFFSLDEGLLPEVGSRALQRLFIYDESFINNWLVIQKDIYMYSVNHGPYGLIVKFLIWNYLACEVIWN